LRAVERNEPAAVTTLADDLDLDRTTLARNLLPLQRDRLVTLASGDDQRVTEVRLTAKGRKAIAAALPLWQQVQGEIAESLGADRVEQMREFAAATLALSAQRAQASARRR
jgi:DNA-binding MarR family transcriptional regulator